MSKRLEILKKSLEKKEKTFDDKLQHHFDTVKQANGQPLNDKRNGRATLNKWERQDSALRNLKASIEKSKDAIEREQFKVEACEDVKSGLPSELLKLLEDEKITQWRKFPNRFFVVGVERARLVWDEEKKIVMHQYVSEIPKGVGQFEIFKDVFNHLNQTVNKR